MVTEQQARDRLTYWQQRLDASDRGRDSRDPAFIYFAQWARDYWCGEVTQLELGREQERAA